MEIKDFIKKPIVIITGLILISYILFPYFSLSMGPWGSYSKSGLGLWFTIFEKFSFLNFLTIIIPAAAGFMCFQIWKKETSLINILKVVILAMHVILFIWIAFLAEKSSVKFVGFGLWLSLILSIALFFEKQIEDAVCKNNPQAPQE